MAAVSNGSKKERTCEGHNIAGPSNPMVTPLLTDLYQFTMAYAYWKAGKHNERAVEDEIAFLRQSLPSSCEDGFFEYLRSIDCSDVEIYSISEGSVVFPKVPLMRVEGPVAVAQLLETPFVNLINYASLVTTNAARQRFVAGKEKLLLEFGLRRAQSSDEIVEKSLHRSDGSSVCDDFVSLVQAWINKLKWSNLLGGIFGETNQSELAAFTSYALAFPGSFLALVDTYDVIRSGVPNFCAVALALDDLGYKAIGIRLDSGDLAYQSCEARKFFCAIEKEFGVPGFGKMSITASNNLNEETLDALNKQGHEVDAFGIGTHLVTCYAQAALGVVFKLYGKEGYPLVDIMTGENEPPPKVGERILCRHPFSESKRAYVVPQRVEELLKCYWPGSSDKTREVLPPLKQIRERCSEHLSQMRPDHMRRLNPTPYKVSVSAKLYDFIHFLWLNEAPVGELQ
nr:nicotinate phosphoribosyltransferase 2-like [Ipomoea batatas]